MTFYEQISRYEFIIPRREIKFLIVKCTFVYVHQEGEGQAGRQGSKFQNSSKKSKNTFRSYELKGLSKISICMEEGWGLFFHVLT